MKKKIKNIFWRFMVNKVFFIGMKYFNRQTEGFFFRLTEKIIREKRIYED